MAENINRTNPLSNSSVTVCSLGTQTMPRLLPNEFPHDPIIMFKWIFLSWKRDKAIPMQISIMEGDTELEWTVTYSGIHKGSPTFICRRSSPYYEKLKTFPKFQIKMRFPNVYVPLHEIEEDDDPISQTWEINWMNTQIIETDEEFMNTMWNKAFPNSEGHSPESHNTKLPYSAFRILPCFWDFYESRGGILSSRMHYTKLRNSAYKWKITIQKSHLTPQLFR